jgi:hypothetical protein
MIFGFGVVGFAFGWGVGRGFGLRPMNRTSPTLNRTYGDPGTCLNRTKSALNRTSPALNRTSRAHEGRTGPKWSKKYFFKRFPVKLLTSPCGSCGSIGSVRFKGRCGRQHRCSVRFKSKDVRFNAHLFFGG